MFDVLINLIDQNGFIRQFVAMPLGKGYTVEVERWYKSRYILYDMIDIYMYILTPLAPSASGEDDA